MAGYDEATEKRLATIQHQLYENGYVGTHTKDLPQHKTLGTLLLDKDKSLIDLVTKVANETRKFEISFNHIGIFGGSKVLFIAPDTNYNLLQLKENFGDSFDWTPHTTMLIDDVDHIMSAIPIVSKNFNSFRGLVQSIHLYEFWPIRQILSVNLFD